MKLLGGYSVKKNDLSVSRQNNMDEIRYVLGAGDVYDDRAAEKISRIPNIVPFMCVDENGKKSVVSYAGEGITLAMMMKEKLGKKQVLSLLGGVAAVFNAEPQDVLLNYIVKDADYVYVNPENLAVKCIVVPVKREVMLLSEIPEFFKKLLSNMMFDERDTDNYVAQLITSINSNDFSISKFRQQINEQLNRIGVAPIPDAVPAMNVQQPVPNVPPVPQNIQQRPPMPPNVPPMPQNIQQRPPMPPNVPPMPQNIQQRPPMPQNIQQRPPMPPNVPPVPNGQPAAPTGTPIEHGSLVGQLGSVSKPVPHIVRKKTGEHIYINKPEFAIGKSKTRADYALEDNPAISRVHCIIVQKNGVNYIRDNHSTNHTFLNGVELEPEKEALLKHKTVIQMGDEEFIFLLRKGD
jgi:hypothetical protein